MKHPQPDLSVALTNTFVAKTGANRKLKRLWGTTIIGGIEVLNPRRHYYKPVDRPANYQKLFKFLKVWNDVKDYKGDGIKSAWFTLNKSNGPENLNVPASFISDNLNKMWWNPIDGVMPNNLTLTTSIVISEKFNNSSSITGIDWNAPIDVIKQYIISNYESMWTTRKIIQEGIGVINKGSIHDPITNTTVQDNDDLSPDDPWLAILARYALRTSGVPCTVKDVEVGIGIGAGTAYTTTVVTIEIPYHLFVPSDPIVQSILHDLDPLAFPKVRKKSASSVFNGFATNNEQITQTLAKQVNYYVTVDDIDVTTISRSYLQWEDSIIQVSIYNNFWLHVGDKWYFKADVINNPSAYGTTQAKLNNYLFSLFDTGFKKEKVPLWKKIVALVVFIVAVVISFNYPPASAASSDILSAAYAVMVGSLVISLVTLAFSAIGANEWAMAFADASKTVEPLVTIASIIMIVDFYSQTIDVIEKKGLEMALKGIADDLFLTGLKDLMSGTLSISAIKVVNKAVDVYTNVQLHKLDSIANRIKDIKAESATLIQETQMNSDVMRSFMNIYARPATADWSMYAATYDLPYERGGGNLSIGNIQRTTKQATRKADYNEPIFGDLIFM